MMGMAMILLNGDDFALILPIVIFLCEGGHGNDYIANSHRYV